MAKRVVYEKNESGDFEVKSTQVLAMYSAESVQNMSQAELQRLKSLLGHGDEWTTWSTPREWFPSGSPSFWDVRIRERLVAHLPDDLVHSMHATLSEFESTLRLENVLDQAVLACNRYLVLCRIAPVHLGVKFRLFIDTLAEQFRFFLVPVFKGIDWGDMPKCALRDVVVVSLPVVVQG